MRDYDFKNRRRPRRPVYPTASLLSEAMTGLGLVAGLVVALLLLLL